jgi:phosphomannomutase
MAQLRARGETLESLLEPLAEPAEAVELRLPIQEENFKECGERVVAGLEAYAQKQPGWQIAPDNREGMRISFGKSNGDGWLLLRLSVHDPLMPLNIESDTVGGTKLIAGQLYAFLRTCTGVDISPVETFIHP